MFTGIPVGNNHFRKTVLRQSSMYTSSGGAHSQASWRTGKNTMTLCRNDLYTHANGTLFAQSLYIWSLPYTWSLFPFSYDINTFTFWNELTHCIHRRFQIRNLAAVELRKQVKEGDSEDADKWEKTNMETRELIKEKLLQVILTEPEYESNFNSGPSGSNLLTRTITESLFGMQWPVSSQRSPVKSWTMIDGMSL